ncbi:MAG: DUF3014 domain-containing protein [Gammaproteobacteria bacterium]|nr:DUF3014 domain-containing protein [Gammaproteobacteria bacterium]
MKRFFLSLLFVVLVVALSAVYLQWRAQQHATAIPPAVVEAPPPSAPSEPPTELGPRYPIPVPAAPSSVPPSIPPSMEESPAPSRQEPPAQEPLAQQPDTPVEPLPTLNDSAAAMTEVFTDLLGADAMRALFNPDEIVRRFVLTIDTLPNKKLPRQQLLVKRVAGPFLVADEGGQRVIGPDNAARYAPYVQLAMRIDAKQLVGVYVRFYPLFQEAYAELGTPNAYFNDRLVEVIDHLLATPTVAEPIRLVQPKVFYEYADPALERLSAGQKILLRMGSANAGQIKEKLREIRRALIGMSQQRGDEGGDVPVPDPVMQAPEGDWKIVP